MLILKDRNIGATSLAFSPDGTRLAVGGYRGLVQVWNLSGQKVERNLPDCKEIVKSLIYLAEDDLLGLEGGSLHRWNLTIGELVHRHPTGKAFPAHFAAFARQARSLFLYGGRWESSGSESVWQTQLSRRSYPDFEAEWSIRSPGDGAEILDCTTDGALVFCAAESGFILLRNGKNGKVLRQKLGGSIEVSTTAGALSPDGKSFAWCAATHLRLWRLDPAEEVAHTTLGKTHFLSVSWHPSGTFFATANGDGKVDYWDSTTGERRESFDWKIGKLHDVVFDATGDRAACCGKSGEVVVWDVDI